VIYLISHRVKVKKVERSVAGLQQKRVSDYTKIRVKKG